MREIIHEKNLEASFYPKLNEFIREFIEENKLVSELNLRDMSINAIAYELDSYALCIKNIMIKHKVPRDHTLNKFVGNLNAPYKSSILLLADFNDIRKNINLILNKLSLDKIYVKFSNECIQRDNFIFGLVMVIPYNVLEYLKKMPLKHIVLNSFWLENAKIIIPIE